MELKKQIERKVTEQQLKHIEKFAVINSKELQKDGKYLVTYTTYSKDSYEQLVNKLVRERYTESEEFAILRKALNEKTNEFYIYNAYVEECKTQAKAFIQERNKVLGE
jgi:hypothetical protein